MTLAFASRLQSLISELAQRITDAPVFAPIRRLIARKFLPLEEEMSDDRYEVRAELPGIEPATDVDVTTHDGWLTITAERHQDVDFNGRSEFAYGSFARSVPLPVGADTDSMTTSYDNGILTVSVPILDTEVPVEEDAAVLALD